MLAHAKLSASGSARWINCSASVQAEAGLQDGGNFYADEGTAAHTLAERCLSKGKPAVDYIGESIKAGSYTFEVDEEMALNVQIFVDYCNNLPVEIRFVEKTVRFDGWVPEGFGTADFIGIGQFSKKGPDRKIIYVPDFKYGKGVMVDALNNSQAMLYGLGVIQTFGFLYDFKEDDMVVCAIVQPRLDHISEFSITVGDLLRWAEKTIRPAVKNALGDNPTFTPGEAQCKWCKAKATCKARADESFKTVFKDFTVITGDLEVIDKTKLSLDEIGIIMQKLPEMYDWGKAVEAYAFDQLNRGQHVPGYKLILGKKGNKVWNEDDETITIQLESMKLKEDEFTKTSISTPTQVIKILKSKKIDEKQIELFWDQPDGKPTIAPESDKKPAIKSAANRDFTAIN